ncbi:MAG: TIM barrel protein [Pirellulales bacterium]
MKHYLFVLAIIAGTTCSIHTRLTLAKESVTGLFAKDNLVAWCIVPFDSEKRGPAERAKMLRRLGISKVAYDWREQHVATFEEEIIQYKKHDLEYFAFWSWHPAMGPLIRKYDIHPQIWITNPSPTGKSQQDRVEAAVQSLQSLVDKARQLNLKLGLYNHGGWGGEPANLVAVCKSLRDRHPMGQIGIIYNFHHGHEHIDDFPSAFAMMLPYLFCVNINGMADPATVAAGTDKILPIGTGIYEKKMLRSMQTSGYHGPVGILDHRITVDAEQSLHENLNGLQSIVASLNSIAE